MPQELISSHRNPLVKRIRKLQSKKYRQLEGVYFIEGIYVVLTAFEQRAPLETIVYAPDLLTSDVAMRAVEEQRAAEIDVVAVTADVFQSLSGRENAVGLGAVVRSRIETIEQFGVSGDDVFVAVEDISDPGNLGTVIRTVDGAGAAGVILLGQSVDPFHPTAVKASMGAIFSVPLAETESVEELWSWARERGVQTIATSAHAAQSFWEAPYRFPALLLLGSEGAGLAEDVQRNADLAVSIPMYGASSSLNLAVAAGLMLYELRRAGDPSLRRRLADELGSG